MAQTLKAHWEPIWNKPHPSPKTINDYLSNYRKSVDLEVPNISLEAVTEVILKPRVSSTGPDGIPFSVYRNLADVAAPLLFRYMLVLASGKRTNRSFNFTNLFFFPKDSSNLPNHLRPISVSNTDNRLMANVIRKLITPLRS
jgi:hypothetical protein